MKRALSSLVPLSVKTALHQRLARAKIERLARAKKQFRAERARGKPRAATIPAGVNLVGYTRADMGLGVAARGLAAALEAAGIPFNVINLERGNYSTHTDRSWSHKEARHPRYDITIACTNPDTSFYLRTEVAPEILGQRYVIGNWYWELPEIPPEWKSEFDFIDEVWAPSNFIKDAVAAVATVPVVHVPTVVQLSEGKRLSRTVLGLPEARFLFLAMFDTKSVWQRKNPAGVLRAFKMAFHPDDSSVGLVMKFNADYEQAAMRELREEICKQKNVLLIDRAIDRDELSSLINACDCFVSLHRSEGFGLGPAEAMSLAKPAIVTNWSGNVDYVRGDNCIPIDYELVKLGQDYGPYKAHQHWAEPDLEQAAYWMKRIVREPELARKIGLNGQETIRSEFSPPAIGKVIQERLQQIRNLG